MGNRQHLDWLLEGVDAWNARREREEFQPDIQDEDIRAAFEAAGKLDGLGRIPLAGANLWRANLWRTVLREADLRGAVLEGADLRGAVLEGADLRGAVLRGADLRGGGPAGGGPAGGLMYGRLYTRARAQTMAARPSIQIFLPAKV